MLAAVPLAGLSAQAAAGADIYVATLARRGAGLEVGTPKNLTNRAGYDNQPSFSADGGMFFYTSQRDGQTDVYRYSLASGASSAVTRTPESEYSPTLIPGGRRISVIRVERDSTQRLWSFALDGGDPRLVLDSLRPIGYHAWLTPDTVFVFVLGAPATLQRAFPATGKGEIVARNIGRTLLRIPERYALSYVQRDSTDNWVRSLDPASGASEPIAPLPDGTEFFAWTPWGDLLSTRANTLVRWVAGTRSWEVIATFRDPGLQRLTRLSVSPQGDRIALVGTDAPR